MLKTLLTSALKTKMAMWAAQLALPDENTLEHKLNYALSGVIAAVLAGVLGAIFIAGVLVGSGFYIYSYTNLSLIETVAVISLLSLTLVLSLSLYAKASFGKVARFKSPQPPTPISASVRKEDPVTDLVGGFIQGFFSSKK